jgi:metal-responsive CopG/Arc/MetJ family transcriptional regulator
MDMVTKNQKIIVRITESQLRWLTDILIQEQRTKSEILREALNMYLIEKSPRHEITENKDKQVRKNG